MKPYYRPSTANDAEILAPKLRKQDVVEVWASHGLSPLEALVTSYNNSSESHTIIASDGEVIGMFGVVDEGVVGIPWLLASDQLPQVAREFLPESRKWVERINQDYLVLTNYVDVRNTVARRWLRWLGFKFIRVVEEFGYGKKPFYEVVRI